MGQASLDLPKLVAKMCVIVGVGGRLGRNSRGENDVTSCIYGEAAKAEIWASGIGNNTPLWPGIAPTGLDYDIKG
jgi:hypothetical protein